MRRRSLLALATLLTALVSLGMLVHAQDGKTEKQSTNHTTIYRISGPYTHRNLAIFLIHGPDKLAGRKFLTLQEALEQKKVIVYETKDVNELAIENRSEIDVYVQAGDIVKGGQQDRMLAVDLIVSPRSGKVPIAAFCVERGRWERRGTEDVKSFGSSTEVVSTREIKLAAKSSNSQSEVWANVAVAQDKLSQNVGVRVNSTVSGSSLQLAVENTKVKAGAESYVKALAPIVNSRPDVIGYAFSINGKINSADVYASTNLFKKLWPKLLKANAVEAIAELQSDSRFQPTSAAEVRSFLREGDVGKETEREVSARIKLLTREGGKNILFETRDRSQKDSWVHRNYIRK